MKQIFLTITLLLLTILHASAIKKFEPNPINVATLIVEKTDSAQIASTCEYYGFAYQGAENGYTVMKRSNGNEIKFTFNDNGTLQKYPIIVVKAKETHKEIDARLKELNFEKTGNSYDRIRNQYSKYKIQCKFGPHNTLILHRIAQ